MKPRGGVKGPQVLAVTDIYWASKKKTAKKKVKPPTSTLVLELWKYEHDKAIFNFFKKEGHKHQTLNNFNIACSKKLGLATHAVEHRIRRMRNEGVIPEISKRILSREKAKQTKPTPAQRQATDKRLAVLRTQAKKSKFFGLENKSLVEEYVKRLGKKDEKSKQELREIRMVIRVTSTPKHNIATFRERIKKKIQEKK